MTLGIYRWKELNAQEKDRFLQRSEIDIQQAMELVRPLVEDVRRRGDAALREYTRRFDSADIDSLPIRVSEAEFEEAERALDPRVKEALDHVIENVRRFHLTQMPAPEELHELRPGLRVSERATPIDSAGLYVPRGRGSFPSMLYMLAIPAVLAGVPHIAIATPPGEDGRVDPACLYAASRCGVDRVYRVGGSQAIAALAYGTESVKKVVKVVGPGSMYVSAAKRLLADRIDPGLPAGPSESIIIADSHADPRKVVLDLFTEAEHGSDSAAILLSDSEELAEKVRKLGSAYLQEIPQPRRDFIRDVFAGYGGIILTETLDEAFELANEFATEHLQLQVRDPEKWLARVRNAGEILLGDEVPFTLANYGAGPNAVLPTGGKSRSWSAVSVRDFIKYSSVVRMSPRAHRELSAHVQVLAQYEGFYTHHQALVRRED